MHPSKRSETVNPRAINFMAYALFSFPLTYILVIGAFYNLPWDKIGRIFFSVYYIVHSLIAIFAGWSLHKMKPFAWHLFLFHAFLLSVEQCYLAYFYAENYHVGIPLAFSQLMILVAVLFLKSELRVPYFSPRIAWWESDPRYKISVPVHMTSQNHYHEGEIMDISSGGCFIKSKAPLLTDDVVNVSFALFDHQFTCAGKIVWRTESAVTHPKGVGIKFLNLSKQTQAELKRTVKKLKKLSSKFQKQRKEERASSFQQKVENLVSQKKTFRS
jgi:uncharacterized protein (TIGR02266 family)